MQGSDAFALPFSDDTSTPLNVMPSDLFDVASGAFEEAFIEVAVAAGRGAIVVWVWFMGFFGSGFMRSRVRILYVMAACVPVAAVVGWLGSQDMGRETLHQWFLAFFCTLIPLWSGCLWRAWIWNMNEEGERV